MWQQACLWAQPSQLIFSLKFVPFDLGGSVNKEVKIEDHGFPMKADSYFRGPNLVERCKLTCVV